MINHLKRNGWRKNEIISIEIIPIIEMRAIEFIAGCFASISDPRAIIVVNADKNMLFRLTLIVSLFVLYFFK